MPVARACPGLLASEVWPLTLPTGVREGSAVLRWMGGGGQPPAPPLEGHVRDVQAKRLWRRVRTAGRLAAISDVPEPQVWKHPGTEGSAPEARARVRHNLSGDSGYLGTVHFHTWAPRSWAPSEPGSWFSARLESGWHHRVLVNRSRHRPVVNSQSSRRGRGAQGLRYPARWLRGHFSLASTPVPSAFGWPVLLK